MTSVLLPAPSGTELRIFGWKGVLPRLAAPAGNCPSFAVGPREGSAAAAACRARFRRWSRWLDPARQWWRCAGLAAAFVRPAGRSQRRVGAGQKGQDLADRAFPASGLREREVRLDLVAVAAAVLLLDHVAGLGQLGDDAVSAALGDAQAGRDVAQPRAGVVCDAHQHPGVAGQEAPVRHDQTVYHFILESYC